MADLFFFSFPIFVLVFGKGLGHARQNHIGISVSVALNRWTFYDENFRPIVDALLEGCNGRRTDRLTSSPVFIASFLAPGMTVLG